MIFGQTIAHIKHIALLLISGCHETTSGRTGSTANIRTTATARCANATTTTTCAADTASAVTRRRCTATGHSTTDRHQLLLIVNDLVQIQVEIAVVAIRHVELYEVRHGLTALAVYHRTQGFAVGLGRVGGSGVLKEKIRRQEIYRLCGNRARRQDEQRRVELQLSELTERELAMIARQVRVAIGKQSAE